MSVWFITGASRGFGRELVSSALAHGDQVVAAARHPRQVADACSTSAAAAVHGTGTVRSDVSDLQVRLG
jgi:NAD(P)-dependent dehydrogenase (short-subunit alcohol dehydrogenase family)